MTVLVMRVACVICACVVALGVLAGCDDDSDDGMSTQEGTVTESTTPDKPKSTEGTETETSGTEAAKPAFKSGGTAATVVRRGPRYFETPSSNIGCYIDQRAVRCDIRERNWDPPPPDRPCELDYGQGIALSVRGRADFVCAGDTALGGPATLEYGAVTRRGFLRCRSGMKGITCNEVRSGHGFFLAREGYRIF